MVDFVENNVFFDPMNKLFQVLNDQVIDVNKERSSKVDPKARQWIFPTFPEANDENYPRIALIPGTITFEGYGSGNFLQDVDNGLTGNARQALRTNFAKVAVVPITVGVFVKKRQKHKVALSDGTVHKFQNSKLADFLANQVAKTLQVFRPEFIKSGIDIDINTISTTYEDNDFLWAKNVEVEMQLMDVWTQHYSEADLIKVIEIPKFGIAM